MPVHRSGPHTLAPCDLVERHAEFLGSEELTRGLEDPLAVSPGVRAHRLRRGGRLLGRTGPGLESQTCGAYAPNTTTEEPME